MTELPTDEMLDCQYADYNREATYVAKLGEHKYRVSVSLQGPVYSHAYVDVLNTEMKWTRLAEEPYAESAQADREAYSKGPGMRQAYQEIVDGIAARLFQRAKTIMEA